MQNRKSYCHIDITGERFGRLTAIKKVKRSSWLFHCDCGKDVVLAYSRVLYGQESCGCLGKEVGIEWGKSHKTHGETHTKLYRKYRSMIDRCYRKDAPNYKRYGGREITVCDEWLNSFEAFKEWSYNNGYDPNKDGKQWSIDRIDNSKGYSPDNCRFTTAKEQMRNRDCTTLYPYKGKMYSASEFADEFGITDKSFVYRRLQIQKQTLEYILEDWNKIHNVPSNMVEVDEYAREIGVNRITVIRWINTGKLSGEKIGRKWYVQRSELKDKSDVTNKESVL